MFPTDKKTITGLQRYIAAVNNIARGLGHTGKTPPILEIVKITAGYGLARFDFHRRQRALSGEQTIYFPPAAILPKVRIQTFPSVKGAFNKFIHNQIFKQSASQEMGMHLAGVSNTQQRTSQASIVEI
jgi:hypothetical protein